MAKRRSADEVVRQLSGIWSREDRPCEIEATPRGVIVYASTRVDAEHIARGIQRAAAERDHRACVLGPEKDEAEALPWWAEACFDWRRF